MDRSPHLLLVVLLGLCFSASTSAQTNPASSTQLTNIQAEMTQAMQRVRLIVNQPVTRYARQRGMSVRVFSPGWFHDGAAKPDFNNVDVRTTQERIYDQMGYVTSDLNRGVVFVGSQLEFNSMTKYFYTDRSLPKKKLTEAEMVEINRLYRIIGRSEQQLMALQNPQPQEAAEVASDSGTTVTFSVARIPRSRLVYGGGAILVVVVLYAGYRKLAR